MKIRKAALLIASLLSGWYFMGCVSTSAAFPATASLTPASSPIATPAHLSSANAQDHTLAFPVGPGGADVIPHQIVRTADDRLYLFALKGDSSTTLEAYWTVSAGLPRSTSDFSGSLQLDDGVAIISVATVYDGSHIVHVLTNDQSGKIIDRPFDTSANQFKAAEVLDTSGGTVSGAYVGTSGIAGMVDEGGRIHLVFWSASNHIIYRSYTYNFAQDKLTLQSGPAQLDANGSANHPALAVSPLDGAVTVAWVSQASNPAQILARALKSGTWGSIETVSNAPVWTSTSAGINIDQGPSLIIASDGTKYLAYIEDWRSTAPADYGRVHFVYNSGSGWIDQYIGYYSHDPSLAINSTGQIYIIGHGYPLNPMCTSVLDFCLYRRGNNGVWATPQVFLAHQGNQSFDSSSSVKWSVVGFNQPDTIEFIFSDVGSGYDNPVLYYGRVDPDPVLGNLLFLPFLRG
jgi:hypothetical protein